MASVATAPNDSSDDRSGTETKVKHEEHQEDEIAEESDSEATVTDDLGKLSGKALSKISELQKKKKQLTAQNKRVLKQRDDNARKHATVLENKKTLLDGTKKRHKTEVSELRGQLKRQKLELTGEHKAELLVKNDEYVKLHRLLKIYEKDRKVDAAEIGKLQAAFMKEKASLSSNRLIYATARRNIDQLNESNKELHFEIKKLKKKLQDDQAAKYSHDQKMLELQTARENNAHERKQFDRASKEVSDTASLQAKKDQILLTHSLRKKSKDQDVLRKEIAKKRQDVEVSQNVGTIAASLRNKQTHINNGTFNAHLSLDAVSFCFLKKLTQFCYSHSLFLFSIVL
jgi:hypothetical protein